MSPVSWTDCAGGGQVVGERGVAYVGNMHNPQPKTSTQRTQGIDHKTYTPGDGARLD
jgi:hypothetical protein